MDCGSGSGEGTAAAAWRGKWFYHHFIDEKGELYWKLFHRTLSMSVCNNDRKMLYRVFINFLVVVWGYLNFERTCYLWILTITCLLCYNDAQVILKEQGIFVLNLGVYRFKTTHVYSWCFYNTHWYAMFEKLSSSISYLYFSFTIKNSLLLKTEKKTDNSVKI